MVFAYVSSIPEFERIVSVKTTKIVATPCEKLKVGDVLQSTAIGDTLRVLAVEHHGEISKITLGGSGCLEPNTCEYASSRRLLKVEQTTLQ